MRQGYRRGRPRAPSTTRRETRPAASRRHLARPVTTRIGDSPIGPRSRMLTINEIFHSIQGESTRAGAALRVRPAHRVRPALPLVRHALRLHRGAQGVRRATSFARCADIDCDLVEVTGGEPLLQPDVYPLMDALLDAGKTVLLETGGHVPLDRVPGRGDQGDGREVPGQRRVGQEPSRQPRRWLTSRDEVKFVIVDRADYEFARDVVRAHDLAERVSRALLARARVRRPAAAGRVDPRRCAARAPPGPAAQVHLGHRPERCVMATAAPGRRAPERRPRLDDGGRHGQGRGLRGERAHRALRAGARVRGRGRAGRRTSAGRRAPRRARSRPARASPCRRSPAPPPCRRTAPLDDSIPSTYVPARNTVFLSLALAWAESLGAADVFLGVNALDYSGYPDCRPEFVAAFERLARLATKAGVEGGRVHHPHAAHLA